MSFNFNEMVSLKDDFLDNFLIWIDWHTFRFDFWRSFFWNCNNFFVLFSFYYSPLRLGNFSRFWCTFFDIMCRFRKLKHRYISRTYEQNLTYCGNTSLILPTQRSEHSNSDNLWMRGLAVSFRRFLIHFR